MQASEEFKFDESFYDSAIDKEILESIAKERDCTLLEVPVIGKNGLPIDHHYYLQTKKIIGRGTFGVVYLAYAIDEKTKQVSSEKMAVKVIDRISEFSNIEYEIFRRYYKAEAPLPLDGKIYLVTEYLPGHDLFDHKDELNEPFRNLDFGTTLELLYQISMMLNLLHHETARTGEAISHCDIKGANIRAEVKGDGKVNVAIIDFGLSDKVSDDPSELLADKAKGSPYYAPHETTLDRAGKRGLKSDIWALTPIFISLLGGENPFRSKNNMTTFFPNDLRGFYSLKYDIKGILERFKGDLALIDHPVTHLILQFINRMQADYQERPDSDQLLRFTTSLNLIYKLTQQKILKEHEHKTALAHLSRDDVRRLKSEIVGLKETIKKHYCYMIVTTLGFLNLNNEIAHHLRSFWPGETAAHENKLDQLWQAKLSRYIDHPTFQEGLIKAFDSHTLKYETIVALLYEAEQCQVLTTSIQSDLKIMTGFHPHLITAMENLAENDPKVIEVLMKNLRNYEEQERKALIFLMKYCSDFKVEFTVDMLRALIKDRAFDRNVGVIMCVNAFITIEGYKKEPEGAAKIFSFFGNHRSSDIISAAADLRQILVERRGQLTPRDQSILNRTALGPLLKEFNIQFETKHMVGKNF